MSPSFGVIGLGHFGTALANHLARKSHLVIGWTNQRDVASAINQNHKNPNYLTDIVLSENLSATSELFDLSACRYLLCALPAKALSQVLPCIKSNKEAVFINATKGFDPHSFASPIDLARKYLPDIKAYAVLSGPGFAKDIVIGKPAGLVMACDDFEMAKHLAEIFASSTLKIYPSDDVRGVELGGVLKNIIAIAAGVSDGLQLGDSARAGIITRGLAEMIRIATALGAQKETFFGLSGLGDLVLTATGDASRNRQLGLQLASGRPAAEIIQSLGSVAEGALAAPIIAEIAKRHHIELPITEAVCALLKSEITPQTALERLVNRAIKREF